MGSQHRQLVLDIMGNIHTCGPNETLVISGGCFGSTGKNMVTGSWAWAWWLVTDVQRMSLEVMTLNPMCDNVETKQGVPLTVTGVAQVKIMKDEALLTIAAEQFLGKREDEIVDTILQTLEGHLRAILGTLTVEEVYKDRDQFAKLVREIASPDVGRMGIEILSFTIKDVYDNVEYLASLGKTQTAAVKRDAERRKQIEIEEQEIKRKEKELISTVRLPAEAEAYKVQTVAEGTRTKTVEAARADGEKIRLIGGAEAKAVEAVGRAEAESMRMKASAYKQYGDAAIMSLVLEALPQIAAEVAAPLAKTDEIVLIGGSDRTTEEINKLVGTLPPAIQALSGVDITGALGKIPGAVMTR